MGHRDQLSGTVEAEAEAPHLEEGPSQVLVRVLGLILFIALLSSGCAGSTSSLDSAAGSLPQEEAQPVASAPEEEHSDSPSQTQTRPEADADETTATTAQADEPLDNDSDPAPNDGATDGEGASSDGTVEGRCPIRGDAATSATLSAIAAMIDKGSTPSNLGTTDNASDLVTQMNELAAAFASDDTNAEDLVALIHVLPAASQTLSDMGDHACAEMVRSSAVYLDNAAVPETAAAGEPLDLVTVLERQYDMSANDAACVAESTELDQANDTIAVLVALSDCANRS